MSIQRSMTVAAVAATATLGSLTQVHAGEWEFNPGGYYDGALGADADPGDLGGLGNFRLRTQIVSDNGLTFNVDLDLDLGLDDGEAADESSLLSEDRIRFGDPQSSYVNNGNFPAGVDPNISLCGAGTKKGSLSPTFAGFQINSNYVYGDEGSRGSLATEIGGVLVNPAVTYRYDLNGIQITGFGTACFDTSSLFPTYLSFGLDHYDLEGDAAVSNQQFLDGVGVVGVGGIPGTYAGFPTDIQSGLFNVERTHTSFTTRLDRPLVVGAWRPHGAAQLFTLNGIAGIKAGVFDQTETVRTDLDSPVFGANSDWRVNYDTGFDGQYVGGFVGLSLHSIIPIDRQSSFSYGLTGTVGFSVYDIDVSDSVTGTGLGGALNYANSQNHSYSESVLTAGLTASIGYQYKNWNVSGRLGVDWGTNPTIEYHRPDSDAGGALSPTLRLDSKPYGFAGVGIRFDF